MKLHIKLVCLLAALATTAEGNARRPTGAGPAVASSDPIAVASRLAKWQLRQIERSIPVSRATTESGNPRAWEQAVFWIGMTALADESSDADPKRDILSMGRMNGWAPDANLGFADNVAIAQVYLWAAGAGVGSEAMTPTRSGLDRVLAAPPRVGLAFFAPGGRYEDAECLRRWCWCDALFMSPPAFLQMTALTGDRRYRDYALAEFWATVGFLYDPAERLFYRDSRFFERRDADGRKLFWSRGNGWAFASMARMIPLLPNGPERSRMSALFVEMAQRIRSLQKPDGYWSPSLLSPGGSPPESSGTAFYTYGLAWGVRSGLLPRWEFEPSALRGWKALLAAVQPDGSLGWVQQVSDRPEAVAAADTQYYGVGAFLLAATQIARIAEPSDRAGRPGAPGGAAGRSSKRSAHRADRTE